MANGLVRRSGTRRETVPSSGPFWAVALGGILVLDAVLVKRGRESLSQAYARAVRAPHTRLPVIAGTTYLIAHLAGVGERWPTWNRFDPLHRAAERLR